MGPVEEVAVLAEIQRCEPDIAEDRTVDDESRPSDPVGERELVAGESQDRLVGSLEVGVERLLSDDRGIDELVDEERVGEVVRAVVVVVIELGDEPGVGGVETGVEAFAESETLGEVDRPGVAQRSDLCVDVRRGRSGRSW